MRKLFILLLSFGLATSCSESSAEKGADTENTKKELTTNDIDELESLIQTQTHADGLGNALQRAHSIVYDWVLRQSRADDSEKQSLNRLLDKSISEELTSLKGHLTNEDDLGILTEINTQYDAWKNHVTIIQEALPDFMAYDEIINVFEAQAALESENSAFDKLIANIKTLQVSSSDAIKSKFDELLSNGSNKPLEKAWAAYKVSDQLVNFILAAELANINLSKWSAVESDSDAPEKIQLNAFVETTAPEFIETLELVDTDWNPDDQETFATFSYALNSFLEAIQSIQNALPNKEAYQDPMNFFMTFEFNEQAQSSFDQMQRDARLLWMNKKDEYTRLLADIKASL